MKEIKRGEIYSADFGTGFGSEQGGVRPVLILQNNTGNKHSLTTIVAAITGRKTKAALPTHVAIMTSGLKTESTVLLEQIKTIDKARLGEYIGRCDSKIILYNKNKGVCHQWEQENNMMKSLKSRQ